MLIIGEVGGADHKGLFLLPNICVCLKTSIVELKNKTQPTLAVHYVDNI